MFKLIVALTLFSHTAFGLTCDQQQGGESFDDLKMISDLILKLRKDGAPPITLDPKLLRSWTDGAEMPCTPPFKVVYASGKKRLTFLAFTHLSGPVTPQNSDLSLIKKEIDAKVPGAVLIESVTGGMMPKAASESIGSGCYQDQKFVCGEAAYTAFVAGTAGSEVWGGEPIPERLNDGVFKTVDREQLLAFRSTQAVLGFKRQGLPETAWKERFNAELSKDIASSTQEWSFDLFKKWVRENLKSDPSQVSDAWIEPKSSAPATPLQQVAAVVETVREPFILKSAERLINEHDEVMIVYGAGHFYKQAPAYEKIFGRPQIQCLGK